MDSLFFVEYFCSWFWILAVFGEATVCFKQFETLRMVSWPWLVTARLDEKFHKVHPSGIVLQTKNLKKKFANVFSIINS